MDSTTRELVEKLRRMAFFDIGGVGKTLNQAANTIDALSEKGCDTVNKLKRPERPFLLLTEDADGTVSYSMWDNENNMREDAIERSGYGEEIVLAIEIASCRTVDISKNEI